MSKLTRRRRIWGWLTLAIVAVLGGLFVYLRLFSGRVLQRLPSPDGQVVAAVSESVSLSPLDADSIGVELRSKYTPLRHFIFWGLDYGTSVTISWTDSRNLVVKCAQCTSLAVYGCEQQCRDVVVHYVFADGFPDFPPNLERQLGRRREFSAVARYIQCLARPDRRQ
jgi:hypothetical protein